MKLLNKRTGENSVKKYISLLIILSFTFAAFAQNVKPYTIDLNGIQAFNDDKSVTQAERLMTKSAHGIM